MDVRATRWYEMGDGIWQFLLKHLGGLERSAGIGGRGNDIEAIGSIGSVANDRSISGELGFSYPNVLEAIKLCTMNGIAVLGVELFQVRNESFETKKMSGYDLPNPKDSWGDYVAANNSLAEELVRFNPSGDDHVYVLTSSSWSEFCRVQDMKKAIKQQPGE